MSPQKSDDLFPDNLVVRKIKLNVGKCVFPIAAPKIAI